ncbi:hypothetical protein [Dactylosporangium sp. CA-139066]|uniref:hypothetical protein n=1 Tax=Dactylosporangium sp. CA-139066 TaxID=3239930 RepID=UPI003D8C5DDE
MMLPGLNGYQLHTGDLVQLRLKNSTGDYSTVPFHVAGVITEFATAPRDSFVLANRSYLAIPSLQQLLAADDVTLRTGGGVKVRQAMRGHRRRAVRRPARRTFISTTAIGGHVVGHVPRPALASSGATI